MPNRVKSIADVKTFFVELKNESLNFHPDTPLEDYINLETGEHTYSPDKCALRKKHLYNWININCRLTALYKNKAIERQYKMKLI